MAKAKKPIKKQTQEFTPLWRSSWNEIDRAFDNFRQDLEKSFASFPSFSLPTFPKLSETTCDVVD